MSDGATDDRRDPAPRARRLHPHRRPGQRVWDEITETGRIQRALYNTVLESDLQPGSPLRYYSPDRKRVFVVGEVVEVDPPRETGRIPLKTRAMYRVMGWFTFLLPETTKPGYLDE